MLKKNVTYDSPDGDVITEVLYFNFTKTEMVEKEFEYEDQGGFREYMIKVGGSNDGKHILAEMKKLILDAYGVKSEDGRRLIKSARIREEFESSEAYSEFFWSLFATESAGNNALEFIQGVMPSDLVDAQALEKALAEHTDKPVDAPNFAPVSDGAPRQLTQQELVDMDREELKSGLATGKYVLADNL